LWLQFFGGSKKLQSVFVRPSPFILAWPILFLTGCAREPETFAPPVQRRALAVPPIRGLGYFLSMSDPNADAYLVKDVADHGPGTWRWVYDHPVLRFHVPDVPRLKFTMDFAIPERTFRETGPVTLTLRLNGTVFGSASFRSAIDLPGSRREPIRACTMATTRGSASVIMAPNSNAHDARAAARRMGRRAIRDRQARMRPVP
jgi:hypothetical protein